jgi:hypothetical protein
MSNILSRSTEMGNRGEMRRALAFSSKSSKNHQIAHNAGAKGGLGRQIAALMSDAFEAKHLENNALKRIAAVTGKKWTLHRPGHETEVFACAICWDGNAAFGADPCGHVFACVDCAEPKTYDDKCPMCRAQIKAIKSVTTLQKEGVKVFLASCDRIPAPPETMVEFSDPSANGKAKSTIFTDIIDLLTDEDAIFKAIEVFENAHSADGAEQNATAISIATFNPSLFWSLAGGGEDVDATIARIMKRPMPNRKRARRG